jgi:antitoxin HicB
MNDLKHFLSLPYRIELIPDEGGIVARIPDLPGCMSSGDTPSEALEGLEEAKELWISARLEAGHSVPEPSSEESSYSGKFVLRIPKSLHRSLDEKAQHEHMSLNSYVLYLLTERHTRESTESSDPIGHVNVFGTLRDCWDSGIASQRLAFGCGKTITKLVTGFENIDETLEHIAIVPQPPKAARFELGSTKELKKKEFAH